MRWEGHQHGRRTVVRVTEPSPPGVPSWIHSQNYLETQSSVPELQSHTALGSHGAAAGTRSSLRGGARLLQTPSLPPLLLSSPPHPQQLSAHRRGGVSPGGSPELARAGC